MRLDDITPKWLTKTMVANKSLPFGSVTDVQVDLLGGSFGLLSGLARLVLEYDRPDHPGP